MGMKYMVLVLALMVGCSTGSGIDAPMTAIDGGGDLSPTAAQCSFWELSPVANQGTGSCSRTTVDGGGSLLRFASDSLDLDLLMIPTHQPVQMDFSVTMRNPALECPWDDRSWVLVDSQITARIYCGSTTVYFAVGSPKN